jgi:hypothetical protein
MGTSCPDVKGMRSICEEEEEEGLFVFVLFVLSCWRSPKTQHLSCHSLLVPSEKPFLAEYYDGCIKLVS